MNFLIPRFLVDTNDLINQAVTDAKLARDRVLAYTGGAVNIPSGALTPVNWTSERHDTGGLHDNAVNPSRVTVPSARTIISLSFGIQLNFAGVAGTYYASLLKNGAPFAPFDTLYLTKNVGETILGYQGQALLLTTAPGDYWEVAVFQDSGVDRQVQAIGSWLAAEVWE